MSVPLYAFVDRRLTDGIGPVAVIQAVGGAIEMANLLLFLEKDFELFGLLHLDGMQAYPTDFDSLLQCTFHDMHRLVHTALQHIVVEIRETRRGEGKRPPLPVRLLEPNVATPEPDFAPVTPHSIAHFAHRFYDFAFHSVGFVGPVREGVHVA